MPSIAQYHRVSTEEQELNRQRDSTAKYALTNLDADLSDLQRYEDKSTGTNTDRGGYIELMNDIETGEIDVVVAHSVSRIARSIRDLDRTVERIVDDHDAELHIVSENFQFDTGKRDPYQNAMSL